MLCSVMAYSFVSLPFRRTRECRGMALDRTNVVWSRNWQAIIGNTAETEIIIWLTRRREDNLLILVWFLRPLGDISELKAQVVLIIQDVGDYKFNEYETDVNCYYTPISICALGKDNCFAFPNAVFAFQIITGTFYTHEYQFIIIRV